MSTGRELFRLCRDGSPEQILDFLNRNHLGKGALNRRNGFQTGPSRAHEYLPLEPALEGKNLANIRFLLDSGADPDKINEITGHSPRYTVLGKPIMEFLCLSEDELWWKCAARAYERQCGIGDPLENVFRIHDNFDFFLHDRWRDILWSLLLGEKAKVPARLLLPKFREMPEWKQELVIRTGIRKEDWKELEDSVGKECCNSRIRAMIRNAGEPFPADFPEKYRKLLNTSGMMDHKMLCSLMETVCTKREITFLFQHLLEEGETLTGKEEVPAMNRLMTAVTSLLF